MSINAQPFDPAFKLVDNLEDGQVLVYDVSENAFVNAFTSGTGLGNANVTSTIITGSLDVGTGIGLSAGTLSNNIELKSLVAGPNITITDNGDSISIAGTVMASTQNGTNLGIGTGIFTSLNGSNDFQFKSIAVSPSLTLLDDGNTITLGVGPNVGVGTFAQLSNNLSDLSDPALARTNLGVQSIADADAKYIRTDADSLPTTDSQWDIGSPQRRFNDIYAQTFQGTAVLADQLTIQGQAGDFLVYNGSGWEAGVGANYTQTLTLNGTTLELSNGGGAVSLGGFLEYGDLSVLKLAPAGTGDLTYNPANGVFTYIPPVSFSGNYNDLTNKPTIPTDVSQLTDTTNAIPTDISDLTDNTGLLSGGGGAPVSGDYLAIANNLSDLTDVPQARTNLNVQSIPEADAKYIRTDADSLPTQDVAFDIGSPDYRFNDIYAQTFQGTAVLADQLTVQGQAGDHLVYDGSQWVAGYGGPTDVSDLTDTQGLLQHTSLAGYATESYVNDAIANAAAILTGNGMGSITTLDLNNNILTYTNELGQQNSFDLSVYLDNTNLPRIVSGVVNNLSGVATFTRNDGTDFQVDFSGIMGGGGGGGTVSQPRINDADFNPANGDLVLTRDDTTSITTNLDGRYLLSGDAPSSLTDLGITDGTAGQVLTTDGNGSYSFTTVAGGGALGTTVTEKFKVNYGTDGSVLSISDSSAGIISTNILSTAGGIVEVEFSGYNYPPASMMMYGYVKATNEYIMNPLTKDMTSRKIAGGVAGDSFGNLGSNKLTLTLNEANTGASRTFGSTTHAWVILTMSS